MSQINTKLTGNFLKMAKKALTDRDWNRDLSITVPVLSTLSYPSLWMVAVPSSQLVFARVEMPVRSILTYKCRISPGITPLLSFKTIIVVYLPLLSAVSMSVRFSLLPSAKIYEVRAEGSPLLMFR